MGEILDEKLIIVFVVFNEKHLFNYVSHYKDATKRIGQNIEKTEQKDLQPSKIRDEIPNIVNRSLVDYEFFTHEKVLPRDQFSPDLHNIFILANLYFVFIN